MADERSGTVAFTPLEATDPDFTNRRAVAKIPYTATIAFEGLSACIGVCGLWTRLRYFHLLRGHCSDQAIPTTTTITVMPVDVELPETGRPTGWQPATVLLLGGLLLLRVAGRPHEHRSADQSLAS